VCDKESVGGKRGRGEVCRKDQNNRKSSKERSAEENSATVAAARERAVEIFGPAKVWSTDVQKMES
jgi:hypothetical protein